METSPMVHIGKPVTACKDASQKCYVALPQNSQYVYKVGSTGHMCTHAPKDALLTSYALPQSSYLAGKLAVAILQCLYMYIFCK